MKHLLTASICIAALLQADDGLARGGFSSGGGRGGFSSSRSFSSGTSRSYSSPSRSYGTGRSYSTPRSTTTTSTTRRSYGGSYGGGYGYHGYYGGYGWHPMMYGPFGMGYGYSNGLLEGLIIGDLMHPAGTTVYSGGGYQGNALLYPDGTVVNQQGYQVGTYANGQFNAVANGQLVAQPAPAQPPATTPALPGGAPPQVVVVPAQTDDETDALMAGGCVLLMIAIVAILCI